MINIGTHYSTVVVKNCRAPTTQSYPESWVSPFSEAGQNLIDRGAELIIAGCTEIPLVFNNGDVPFPWLNPTAVLAEAAVRRAMQH